MSCPFTETEILSRVLYRDGLVLVLDKPPGIAVHAGPGGGPNLEACFHFLRFGLPKPPFLAHRLDRDTSGCLVLGRHAKALRKLARLFSEGQVRKTYWALVRGSPPDGEGVVDQPLLKISSKKSGWRMVIDPDGQRAVTHYRVRGQFADMTWLELAPQTGRTHQIRVHCASLGCPILGDPVYGQGKQDRVPMMLHARAIALPLYPAREDIAVIAPPPAAMIKLLEQCGYESRP